MTEEEWKNGNEPISLIAGWLDVLATEQIDPLLRLVICGMARTLFWNQLSEDNRSDVNLTEAYVFREIDEFGYHELIRSASLDYYGVARFLTSATALHTTTGRDDTHWSYIQLSEQVLRTIHLERGRIAAGPTPPSASHPDHPWHVAFQSAVAEADSVMADLLRCIIGNPFRPPTAFDPAWRTSAVLGIAKQIDETRTFGNLPVLADALQDAGCEVAPMLDHCRGTHHHARGCWVLEQILDRNRRDR